VSRWRAVIFDLDDTLYPEHDYVLSGFRAAAEWAERRGLDPAERTFESLESMFREGVRGDTFNRWLALKGLPPELAGEMVEAYRAHAPQIRPYPDVLNLLHALHGSARLGLVSDGYLAVQRAKFAALDLGQFFSAVVFSDELGRECWKPSRKPFERVLAMLGVPARDAVYVADNCAKDFIGARSVGLSTVWARHSGGDYCRNDPPSEGHAADFVTHTVEELAALVGGGAGTGSAPADVAL
jgi:putative hydrolase of the HAD superfamily